MATSMSHPLTVQRSCRVFTGLGNDVAATANDTFIHCCHAFATFSGEHNEFMCVYWDQHAGMTRKQPSMTIQEPLTMSTGVLNGGEAVEIFIKSIINFTTTIYINYSMFFTKIV